MGDSKDTEPQDTNTAQSSAILDDGLDSVDDIMVGMYDGSESGFKTAAMAGSSTPLTKLDLDQVAALPLVTTTCMEPIIYVHAGQPRAVDGPNPLAVDRKLVYWQPFRLRTSIKKDDGTIQMMNRSKHVDAFYGRPTLAVGSRTVVPLVTQTKDEMRDAQTDCFRKVCVFSESTQDMVVYLCEVIGTIGLRAMHDGVAEWQAFKVEVGYKGPTLDYMPLNRQFPSSQPHMGLKVWLSIQRTRVLEGSDTWNFDKGAMADPALNAARHKKCAESANEKRRCANYDALLDGTYD
ncbi:hypothetical protein P389DRAFT_196849 [Cystobasidium minutum MCA 4210]|uniref:uncharacterized protein n=1 Tax=Cystobasidium minutum MCA 4210 TaxID=1397322 RepID=UPI0034CD1D1A|eukprot:jgi/Rhomi1/196849/gm1.5063_g